MKPRAHACPCCGHLALGERARFEICSVCFWEDDGQDDVDAHEARGGPNRSTLWEARASYLKIGACDDAARGHVRPPAPDEPRVRQWSLLEDVAVELVPSSSLAIHPLNASAFETDAEARLVDALRANGALTLSLVAIANAEVVGHVAFSPVVIEGGERTVTGVGLAPMAVASAHRRRGIGGRLIEEGLRRLRARGEALCVVLGHADYYPRHGFERASRHGIRWEKPVPDDVFFVQELTPGGLAGVSGIVRYRPELDAL